MEKNNFKILATVVACALAMTLFTQCKKDENKPTPTPSPSSEVYFTHENMYTILSNGDTITSSTKDLVWENGLLRSVHDYTLSHSSGSNIVNDQTFIYDNDGNCIELHYTSNSSTSPNHDQYFTYEGGRMIRAVELTGGDTTGRVTITGHTADGHIQSLTVERLTSGTVKEYQLTWENGDVTAYTEHPVTPAGEDKSFTIEYDNYPNVQTGMPVADAVFDPQLIAPRASAHNWKITNQEHFYKNGRLVKTIQNSTVLTAISYFTYSDGTTGRE